MEKTLIDKSFLKIAIVLIFSFLSFKSFAQIKIDSTSVFKMWLYVDMESCKEKDNNSQIELIAYKNDSLYETFKSVIDIKIRKLTSKGFSNDYSFYTLEHFDKNNNYVQNIFYKRPLNDFEKDVFFIGQNNQGARQYVIAINNKNGRSYRLVGFNNSDFLNFLRDFKKDYKQDNLHKKMTTKIFLKNFKLEGVDFKCLYNGIIKDGDTIKYPCLKSCYDPTVTY